MIYDSKKVKILRPFKGKYFTHKKNGKLYKVTNVIRDKSDRDAYKLVYYEAFSRIKPTFCGDYKYVTLNKKDMYCRRPLNFKRNFAEIKDEKTAIKIARVDLRNYN